ncbi:hypothetical protein L3N51_01157 [Metallosphaera sp. J1]|uniref:hypothetical protein n=1 Tax=Metallosphaera javensis (ex Hofmann et al. 2022) TaxID=99938 RepID=UPI001EE06EC9|nr:hypothetical protein [Metallosphaera javensis (ex Hofmann et al. 2022)]MCG3108868.1 hypothetical protein [Metallosphaera javensis (ex Hofmann et al. 2022)]
MVELVLEQSKSKSGKHAVRSLLFKWDNEPKQLNPKGTKIPPLYKDGEAVLINLKEKGIFIYARFVRNLRGRVRGKLMVIKDGAVSLEMNYRKLKLKRISGDANLYPYVKAVMDTLKIPIKRTNLK